MLKDNFFNELQIGDTVFLVTDSLNIKQDIIMDAVKDKEKNRNTYVHLKKSKMIVTWNNKHYIYPKRKLPRLQAAVQIISDSLIVEWGDELKKLMEEINTPIIQPVPKRVE